MFESSVNSEGIETQHVYSALNLQFESSVNSEGIETSLSFENLVDGLRAV